MDNVNTKFRQIFKIKKETAFNTNSYDFNSIVSFATKLPKKISSPFFLMSCGYHILENVSAYIFSFLVDSFFFNNRNKVFGVPKTNNNQHNVYLLVRLFLCARFVIYRCKYGSRIPIAS